MGVMAEKILARLGEWHGFRVIVIGDFMLDRELHGAAERLSPDAPVPVLLSKGMSDAKSSVGGAGNVARFIQALGGTADCIGVCGADAEGKLLSQMLSAEGCGVEGLSEDTSRPTTVKLGLIGLAQHRHPQKMFRLDFEVSAPISGSIEAAILDRFERLIAEADVVCLEDYSKGVCTDRVCRTVVEKCRQHGVPLLVDPAAISDYSRYRGATCITPNRSEAERATGSATPLEAPPGHNQAIAAKLRESLELEAVVVTLDKHGAMLDCGDGAMHLPAVARSVYDVTGAGDMVLAALAGARANGWSWPEAVAISIVAAGLEVEKSGAQPIPMQAIQRQLMIQSRGSRAKVRNIDELLPELAARRERGERVVLTNGCFDILHAGHVAYLREAKALGDVLVVGLNSDTSVRANKGEGRPVHTESDRADVLSELQSVDFVIIFEQATAAELIQAVRPGLYVKGGDYRPDEIVERDLLKRLGCELRVLQHKEGLSSTVAIGRLAADGGNRS